MQVLLCLAETPLQVVKKEDLIRSVWNNTFVTDDVLTHSISELRKAFEDDVRQPEFIETIPKSGYRLLVSVEDANNNSFEESPDRRETQHIATAVPQGNTTLGSASRSPRNLESRPASHPKSTRRIRAIRVIGAVIVLACVALGIRLWKSHQRRLNLEDVQMVRLTESGNAEDVAISPNGEYVVYVLREGEKRGLRVLQVATGGEVQILAPDVVELKGLTFSPDGNYIFFLRTPKENFLYDSLFQMPVLGGTPRKLIYDVDTPISFSPDGRQFAFVRISERVTHLMIANADGTGERVLASHPGESFDYPAWSPDGRTIAFPGPGLNGEGHVWAVSPLDRRVLSVYTQRSFIGRLHWLPDSNGFLAVIRDSAQGRGQLWYISYPSGEARRVTNDLADYAIGQLDLTRDGKSLVAVESAISSDVWVARGWAMPPTHSKLLQEGPESGVSRPVPREQSSLRMKKEISIRSTKTAAPCDCSRRICTAMQILRSAGTAVTLYSSPPWAGRLSVLQAGLATSKKWRPMALMSRS